MKNRIENMSEYKEFLDLAAKAILLKEEEKWEELEKFTRSILSNPLLPDRIKPDILSHHSGALSSIAGKQFKDSNFEPDSLKRKQIIEKLNQAKNELDEAVQLADSINDPDNFSNNWFIGRFKQIGILCQGASLCLGGNERYLNDSIEAFKAALMMKPNSPEIEELLNKSYALLRQIKRESSAGDSTQKGGGCFIATAVYGTSMAKEVKTLRVYRDKKLLHSRRGRAFFLAYNQIGPPLAEFISQRAKIKRLVRVLLLKPAVWFVKRNNR